MAWSCLRELLVCVVCLLVCGVLGGGYCWGLFAGFDCVDCCLGLFVVCFVVGAFLMLVVVGMICGFDWCCVCLLLFEFNSVVVWFAAW